MYVYCLVGKARFGVTSIGEFPMFRPSEDLTPAQSVFKLFGFGSNDLSPAIIYAVKKQSYDKFHLKLILLRKKICIYTGNEFTRFDATLS